MCRPEKNDICSETGSVQGADRKVWWAGKHEQYGRVTDRNAGKTAWKTPGYPDQWKLPWTWYFHCGDSRGLNNSKWWEIQSYDRLLFINGADIRHCKISQASDLIEESYIDFFQVWKFKDQINNNILEGPELTKKTVTQEECSVVTQHEVWRRNWLQQRRHPKIHFSCSVRFNSY